jgi:hypothetical protein
MEEVILIYAYVSDLDIVLYWFYFFSSYYLTDSCYFFGKKCGSRCRTSLTCGPRVPAWQRRNGGCRSADPAQRRVSAILSARGRRVLYGGGGVALQYTSRLSSQSAHRVRTSRVLYYPAGKTILSFFLGERPNRVLRLLNA